MAKHIAQDWRHTQLHFVLETRLMLERKMRDALLDQVLNSTAKTQSPISRSLPMSTQAMFQRKVAAFHYNQLGLMAHHQSILPAVDRHYAHTATIGTREWVPYYNTSAWAFRRHVSRGQVLVHRVFWRSWGTDPSLKKGGWAHRWNKTLERNCLQYRRV